MPHPTDKRHKELLTRLRKYRGRLLTDFKFRSTGSLRAGYRRSIDRDQASCQELNGLLSISGRVIRAILALRRGFDQRAVASQWPVRIPFPRGADQGHFKIVANAPTLVIAYEFKVAGENKKSAPVAE
jgi:hypothetical protein